MRKTKRKKKTKPSTGTETDMVIQGTIEEDLKKEMDGKNAAITRDRDPREDTKTTEITMAIGREMVEIGKEATVETETTDPHGDMKEMIDPHGGMKETGLETEVEKKQQ